MWTKCPREMAANGRESMRGSKLNWLIRYLYPVRGRTAATGSQLMGDDASRLG